MKPTLNRRTLLRGLLQGAAVSVPLPLLDCFLNVNGDALASGAPLPIRFGTWFWGCGMSPGQWTPERTGADYDLPSELQPLKSVRDQVTILSGFNTFLDGKPNEVHASGLWSLRTGSAPATQDGTDLPTIDVLIGDAIGTRSRFRSLDVTASGAPDITYSRRSAAVINPSEPSPAALYMRVFGPEFQDPNAADFKPDPRVMLRQGVLSAVADDRNRLIQYLGAADRVRLDEYFTAMRQTEQQLALQLQKPPPAEACKVPEKITDGPKGTDIEFALQNNKVFAELIAMALACNQTKVFNMAFSTAASTLRRKGNDSIQHTLTHEESVDASKGYQPEVHAFVVQTMQGFADFVTALGKYREGAGTLLDNTLLLAHSDVSFAKVHEVTGLPAMIAGRAGGKIRSGLHVKGTGGDAVTRIGLTVQQVMGVPVATWGTQSMQTSKPISEFLV